MPGRSDNFVLPESTDPGTTIAGMSSNRGRRHFRTRMPIQPLQLLDAFLTPLDRPAGPSPSLSCRVTRAPPKEAPTESSGTFDQHNRLTYPSRFLEFDVVHTFLHPVRTPNLADR